MCGICGVVSFRGEPVPSEALAEACGALRHRGPDQSGVWIDQGPGWFAGLAATRLAVLDPTPAGNQPMHHASGRYTLVHNGEVYNFRELRGELADLGEVFITDGDTEVILAACARWGVQALGRFNGMWAICFYDSKTRSGFLARDRFGVKPLLYSAGRTRLAFASELRALRALGSLDETIDRRALLHHVQFGYIPHPHTIYSAAGRLPPGHWLRFDVHGASEPTRFYDPIERVTARGGASSDGCVRGDLVRTIARAVAVRCVSDVPIGAFLSGGLDSTIVLKHLAEVSPRPVKTFCIGYENHGAFDERRFARLAAARFGADHHEVVITEREAMEAIPRVLDHLDEPFGDASIVPTAMLSRFVRQHVTVALSGDGGDELFAGYWRYTAHRTLEQYRRLPLTLRRLLLEPAAGLIGTSKGGKLSNRVRQFRKLLRAKAADPIARHIAWSRILSPEAEGVLARSRDASVLDQEVAATAEDLARSYAEHDPLARILAFDLQYQLPADMLHKVDAAGMMHSLEVRVPFLDFHVVEDALALPSRLKLDRGIRKKILIEAYRGHVPDEILDRGKQGFEIPVGEYLRGPLQPLFRQVVTCRTVESFGLLSFQGVERAYADHLTRRADHTDLLFAILSLCWWRSAPAAGLPALSTSTRRDAPTSLIGYHRQA